jgi:hypothetical protein
VTRLRFDRLLAAAILLAAGCTEGGGPTGPQENRLGVPFELSAGESAEIRSEPLRIGFRQVTQDSRCPAAAYCIWVGEIVAALDLQVGEATPDSFELSTITRSETRLSGYRVQLLGISSDPYLPGHVADPRSYRATIVITR